MIAASWSHLARQDALARAAAQHVPPDRLLTKHEPLTPRLHTLIERGQRDSAFRTDLSTEWIVRVIYALLHAAADHSREHGLDYDATLAMLAASIRDLLAR